MIDVSSCRWLGKGFCRKNCQSAPTGHSNTRTSLRMTTFILHHSAFSHSRLLSFFLSFFLLSLFLPCFLFPFLAASRHLFFLLPLCSFFSSLSCPFTGEYDAMHFKTSSDRSRLSGDSHQVMNKKCLELRKSLSHFSSRLRVNLMLLHLLALTLSSFSSL